MGGAGSSGGRAGDCNREEPRERKRRAISDKQQSRCKTRHTDFNFFEATNRKVLEDAPDPQPAAFPPKPGIVQRGIQILARDQEPHLRASQGFRGLSFLRPCSRRKSSCGHYLLPCLPTPVTACRMCRLRRGRVVGSRGCRPLQMRAASHAHGAGAPAHALSHDHLNGRASRSEDEPFDGLSTLAGRLPIDHRPTCANQHSRPRARQTGRATQGLVEK